MSVLPVMKPFLTARAPSRPVSSDTVKRHSRRDAAVALFLHHLFHVIGNGHDLGGRVGIADHKVVGDGRTDLRQIQGNYVLGFLFQHRVGNDADFIAHIHAKSIIFAKVLTYKDTEIISTSPRK